MSKSGIEFYYKNVTSDVIGAEHGITPAIFKSLADREFDDVEIGERYTCVFSIDDRTIFIVKWGNMHGPDS